MPQRQICSIYLDRSTGWKILQVFHITSQYGTTISSFTYNLIEPLTFLTERGAEPSTSLIQLHICKYNAFTMSREILSEKNNILICL